MPTNLSEIGDLVDRFAIEGLVRLGDARQIVEASFVDRLVEFHAATSSFRVQIDEQPFADFLVTRLNEFA